MKVNNYLPITVVILWSAAAVPAVAIENEFHGMFSARYINSNFNRTATTDYGPGDGTYDPSGKSKNQYVANFFEQRTRLQYIAKANADLRLVTHFELDYSYWGNSSYSVGRNSGGAIGADSVNIETKSIYLDANPLKNVNLKLGMMPNNDAFKGVLFDTDMAGALISIGGFGTMSPTVGFFRLADKGAALDKVLGHKTYDLFMLDVKSEAVKDLKLGAAYYFFRDNQVVSSASTPSAPETGVLADGTPVYAPGTTFTSTTTANDVGIHVLGLNAAYTLGPLTLSGFAVYENGWSNTFSGHNSTINAYAGNIGARLKAGPGTARGEFLYVSGSGDSGNSAFYAADGVHGYYDNEMTILGRDKNAYTTDNSILYNAGNKGQGQVGVYFGYDLPINDKLTTAFNIGFAGIAHKNGNTMKNKATGTPNASDFLGTEINAEAGYKLMDCLTASIRAGYVILGGYFDNVAVNGTPENPYDAKLIFTYAF
jgi:hypothetical protein